MNDPHESPDPDFELDEEPDPDPEPPEEYFENKATGVEVEEESLPSAEDPEPWDPEKIRIHTKHYSLRQIVDMIAEGDVDLAPDFQRQYVWKDWQRCGLIESLLLGIPLPSFYFNEDTNGRMQVVDGVQRLTTIYSFVHAKNFALRNLAYLKGLEGVGIDGLDGVFRRRLLGSQFVAHVIAPQTPYKVKFDIFRRINTGGTPLSAQEIRHCMSASRSREFLKDLTSDVSFIQATAGSLKDHPRMADREVALRFVAFRVFSVDDYSQSSGLDEFLGKVTERIDRTLSDHELEDLKRVFARGMQNANTAFGRYAFRKWPHTTNRTNPINRALFETWGTVLADYEPARVSERREALVKRARDLMTTDTAFINSIFGSTSDVANVRERFAKVSAAARELLG
jgi:hypothetical protein